MTRTKTVAVYGLNFKAKGPSWGRGSEFRKSQQFNWNITRYKKPLDQRKIDLTARTYPFSTIAGLRHYLRILRACACFGKLVLQRLPDSRFTGRCPVALRPEDLMLYFTLSAARYGEAPETGYVSTKELIQDSRFGGQRLDNDYPTMKLLHGALYDLAVQVMEHRLEAVFLRHHGERISNFYLS